MTSVSEGSRYFGLMSLGDTGTVFFEPAEMFLLTKIKNPRLSRVFDFLIGRRLVLTPTLPAALTGFEPVLRG
jgi:hypothetical protein